VGLEGSEGLRLKKKKKEREKEHQNYPSITIHHSVADLLFLYWEELGYVREEQ